MKEAEQGIDWPKAYARLEETRRTLDAAMEHTPEEVKRILRERAKALAKPLKEPAPRSEVLDLLVFSLAGERYAVETASVLEVVLLRDLTPVPCAPPTILGVVNHRGRILPVLDFRRLLDLTGQEVGEKRWVVVVEAERMTFGIGAEAVMGTIRIQASDLAPPPGTLAGDHQAFTRGVTGKTGEMVVVMDLVTLAHDPRITVNEEVV
nr:purine-binding chemotaxis protein CheW [Nitrospirota bacterium]